MYHYGDSVGINIDDIIKALTNILDNFYEKKKEENEPVTKKKRGKNSKNNN